MEGQLVGHIERVVQHIGLWVVQQLGIVPKAIVQQSQELGVVGQQLVERDVSWPELLGQSRPMELGETFRLHQHIQIHHSKLWVLQQPMFRIC